jgi:hypothetical protein
MYNGRSLIQLDRYFFSFFVGFYIAPTQYRSYGYFLALLEEEDLRCPPKHYFRYKQAPLVEPLIFRKLTGLLTHMLESEVSVQIQTHNWEGQVV